MVAIDKVQASESGVRNERIYVSLPPLIAKRVKELAARHGMSESKVVQLIVFEGFKSVDTTEGHMFRTPETEPKPQI